MTEIQEDFDDYDDDAEFEMLKIRKKWKAIKENEKEAKRLKTEAQKRKQRRKKKTLYEF